MLAIFKVIEAGAIGVRIAKLFTFILGPFVISLFEYAFTAAQKQRRGLAFMGTLASMPKPPKKKIDEITQDWVPRWGPKSVKKIADQH